MLDAMQKIGLKLQKSKIEIIKLNIYLDYTERKPAMEDYGFHPTQHFV